MKNQKIERCITRMVLSQPFYAALALRLRRVEDGHSETTLWTDGVTLAYNPEKVDALRDDQVMGAVCRLVEGLAHQHHTRREGRDAKNWNKASASVCTSITAECGFEICPEDERFYSTEWKDKSAESLYRIIMASPPDPSGGGGGDSGEQNQQGQCQGSGGHGQGNGNGAGSGEIRDFPGTPAERQSAEQEWRSATFQAARIAQAQGNCPAHAIRLCEEITSPKVDWRQELRRFVSTVAHEKYNWTQPNRRYAWKGIFMPSRRSRDVGEIVLAIDTSGSVCDKSLKQFAAELVGILEDNPSAKIQVLYCDTKAYDGGIKTAQDFPITLEAQGGGGTNFRPVFEWVDEHMEDPPKALIYMTDMAGVFPDHPPDYPVLWGVCNRAGDYARPDFGECVEIEIDE
jgi:predicted metal-dependent peptidase